MPEFTMGNPEYYNALSTEDLRKLMLSGDGSACAYYIKRRIDADTLTADDMKYLDTAVQTLNIDAALRGYNIYGLKGCLYEDEEKFALCAAILEQDGYKDAHKAVGKLFKKNGKLINETDRKIYMTAFSAYLDRLAPNGGCDGLFIDIDRADKEDIELDRKHAYVLKAKAATEAGGIFADEIIYVLYPRDKYKLRSLTWLSDRIDEKLQSCYEKYRIRSYRVKICDNIQHRLGVYGGKLKDSSVRRATDAELTVTVSDERLTTSVCSYCGGKLDKNGVCTVCGKRAVEPKADGGTIHIHRAKDMEALHCTQCGGAVTLDSNNKTAFCQFCGTTFIVNGNALSGSVMGIDFNDLRADMPENATLPKIKFVRAKICNDISTILPDNFAIMSNEHRRIKYPVNPPDFIYTTPDTCVNLCMSFRGQLAEEDVYRFGQAALSGLRNIRSDARFGDVKELKINGKNILYFDFMTAALDQSIYNAMFFFSFNGKQAVASWNCLGKDRWFWAPVFEHAVKTIEF